MAVACWRSRRTRISYSFDEKPGIQALKNIAPDLPPTQVNGTVGRDYEYKRFGTLSLLAGMDLLTGEILDNHSAHTSKETQKYLAARLGRFEFVFTPKHGSWLNLIESFFGKMGKQCLKGIRVNSKEELEERIYKYIAEINEHPVVYHWTYKMNELEI